MSFRAQRRLYLLVAVGLAVVTSAFAVWCISVGHRPDTRVLRLYSFIMLFLIISWIVKDSAIPSMHRPSFDYGILVWMWFPVLAAYHLYLGHGRRGLFAVLGLVVLLVLPLFALATAQVVADLH